VDQDEKLANEIQTINMVCNWFFVIQSLVLLYVFTWKHYIRQNWNKLDAILFVTTSIDLYLNYNPYSDNLKLLMKVLKVLRLLRIIKYIQMHKGINLIV
jgi:hypothetical protein